MSYMLYDSRGYMSDFASGGGLSDFNAWALYQDPAVRQMAYRGYARDLNALIVGLHNSAPSEKVQEQADLLYYNALSAKDILIISDGTDDSDGMLRTAAAKQSPMLRVADASRHTFEVIVGVAFASAARVYKKSGEGAALDALETSLLSSLTKQLEKTFTLGKVATIISPALRTNALKMDFKSENLHAKNWAKLHAAELVQGIKETTRDKIREAIANHGAKAQETIEALLRDPVRAESIARTESLRAANEGQLDAWDGAKKNGLLSENAKRVWIATGDDLLCAICEPMDGVEELLDDPFILDDGEAITSPPAHPRCRCTVGLA